MAAAATADSTPWLTEARKLVGLREIIGSKHEAKILQFFAEAGHPNVRDDETSWCAAFANAMLVRSGWAGTGSLLARSFLTWGTALDKPVPGCIVVFKRGNEPWMGHVAFYVGEGPPGTVRVPTDTIRVLGGNQGNAVSTIHMPKADVLGYRWPAIRASAPAKKETPTETAKKVGGAIVGGAVVVKTGEQAVAASASWSWLEIAVAVGGVVLLGVLVWLAVRWWQRKRQHQKSLQFLDDVIALEQAARKAAEATPPATSDPVPASPWKFDPRMRGGTRKPPTWSSRPKIIDEALEKASAPAIRKKPAAKPKPAKPAAKKRRA